jgi:hypothetical protein
VFRGPAVRRLTAEQFADTLRQLTRSPYGKADTRFNRQAALVRRGATLPLQPSWIWATPGADTAAAPASVVFRRTLTLAVAPTEASIALAADDNYSLRINGTAFGSSGRRASTTTDFIDLTNHLCQGENTSWRSSPRTSGPTTRAARRPTRPRSPIPPGSSPTCVSGMTLTVLDVVTDATWTATVNKAQEAQPAVVLGGNRSRALAGRRTFPRRGRLRRGTRCRSPGPPSSPPIRSWLRWGVRIANRS